MKRKPFLVGNVHVFGVVAQRRVGISAPLALFVDRSKELRHERAGMRFRLCAGKRGNATPARCVTIEAHPSHFPGADTLLNASGLMP